MSVDVKDLRTTLADYEDILTFVEVGEYITVKMQYQPGPRDRAKWEAINNQLKQFGGEWIRNGKFSHWKVKRGTPVTEPFPELPAISQIEEKPQLTLLGRLERVRDELDSIIERVREAGR